MSFDENGTSSKSPELSQSTRPPVRVRLARLGLPFVVFAIGAALSFVSFGSIRVHERERRRIEFERQASQIAVSARVGFDVPLEVVRSIPALFEASEEVTRSEFRAFVRESLARYSWIYALEWIPRVPGSERARFEQAAIADGLSGYHFKQDAPNGPPVPAAERSEYFPLFYMEPQNPTALGIEETALESRRVALERARDLGTTVITERLALVQDDRSVVSVIAFHPVYEQQAVLTDVETRRGNLRGFAAAVFRVQPVIATALRDVDLEAVDIALLDSDAPDARSVLYESRLGAASSNAERASAEHVATIGGRRWTFRISDRAGVVNAGNAGWAWLAVGLIASALSAAVAYAAGAMRRLRNQVRAARRLGQYTLVEKLGAGGMGTVYRAHHALLRRPTAIKLLHSSGNASSAIARFEREVQLTSALTHPNTVIIYDYGHTETGLFYYAMEYIDGITLQDLVETHGPQPAGRVVGILAQIAAALAEAHASGLVHRDIKPANIMLCNRGGVFDFVKVLDFGLVKDRSDSAGPELSQSSAVIGTPLYLAPEAIRGGSEVDARADIYGLGALAYFLLSGAPPFSGSTIVEVCAKHLKIPPEPLADKCGPDGIAEDLEALVMRCLSKQPNDRPKSGAQMVTALAALRTRPWTVQQAEQWWRDHPETLDEQAQHSLRKRPQRFTATTIEIDPQREEVVPLIRKKDGREPEAAADLSKTRVS